MVRTEFGRDTTSSDDIVVEKGDPAKVILRVAKERNCDLMVMGITGRRSLEDAMLGDTVRRVLYRTKLPVLVVQHPEQD
jgi:nucleotide-binding universal stress UspA family protein